MKNQIKDKSHVPRELFTFTEPRTGIEYKAHAFGLLVAKVVECCIGNNIPFDPNTIASQVEEDWCNRNPHHCANGEPEKDEPKEMAEAHGDLLTRLAAAVGIPAADALSKVSKMFGVNCETCNHRHRIIRAMRKLGIKETIRQLKETI